MKCMTSRILTCLVALGSASACLNLDVENENDPTTRDVLTTPKAIESLVRTSFIWWWHSGNNRNPTAAMQTAADGTSSSWANYGMRDVSSEPRVRFNNSATHTYREVNEWSWGWTSDALSSVLEGFRAASHPDMQSRMVADLGEVGVARFTAFGKLIQALTLSSLATIFDRGWPVTSVEDLEEIGEAEMYPAIMEKAMGLYEEFLQLAQGAEWVVPNHWVGCKNDWTVGRAVEIARAYRALYAAAVARSPEERASVDWAAIRADAIAGRTRFVGALAFNANCNTAWTGTKHPVLLFPDWSRSDYRWIGPADASGGWEKWIASDLNDRTMFRIDTDDRRITAGNPESDGKYMQFQLVCPFRLDRGIYHCSYYRDSRWDYILEEQLTTDWPLIDTAVFDFLVAEADYRSGDMTSAMEIVNQYRVNSGELPPFTNPSGVAPGGSRCVPQNADGSCGDLWAALKYEKQMEVHGYDIASSHYVDDRGWGDLVAGTWEQLPIPGSELLILGIPNYTFPNAGGGRAADAGGAAGVIGLNRDSFLDEDEIRERMAINRARQQTELVIRDELGNGWK